jgi:hypothetical protein
MRSKSIKNIIEAIGYLNDIQRILTSKKINDSTSLMKNDDIFHTLCSKAHRTYEIISNSDIINKMNRDKYANPRAELGHITSNTKRVPKGFDEIEPEYLWKHHFGPNGYLEEIRNIIKNIRQINTAIDTEIMKKSTTSMGEPIKLLIDSDFSHYIVINEIIDAIPNSIICFIGLLHLLSLKSTPPLKKEFFSIVSILTNLDSEQIKHIAYMLEIKKIIGHSADMNFYLILDKDFAMNTTKDFIDITDMKRLIQLLKDQV